VNSWGTADVNVAPAVKTNEVQSRSAHQMARRAEECAAAERERGHKTRQGAYPLLKENLVCTLLVHQRK